MSFTPSTWYCCCGTQNSNALPRCHVCQTQRGASRLFGSEAEANSQPPPVSEQSPNALRLVTRVLGALAGGMVIAAVAVLVLRGRSSSTNASLTGGRAGSPSASSRPILTASPYSVEVKAPSPIGAPSRAPRPAAPSLASTPNTGLPAPPQVSLPSAPEVDLPPAPSMVGASHPEGFPALPSVMSGVPSGPPPAAPITSSSPWQERTTQQESPEIRIRNASGRPLLFTFGQGGNWIRRDVPTVLYERITPGEFDYAVYGPLYEATGQPDMAGKLRCRRFRLYEVTFVLARGNSTRYKDLGDE